MGRARLGPVIVWLAAALLLFIGGVVGWTLHGQGSTVPVRTITGKVTRFTGPHSFAFHPDEGTSDASTWAGFELQSIAKGSSLIRPGAHVTLRVIRGLGVNDIVVEVSHRTN